MDFLFEDYVDVIQFDANYVPPESTGQPQPQTEVSEAAAFDGVIRPPLPDDFPYREPDIGDILEDFLRPEPEYEPVDLNEVPQWQIDAAQEILEVLNQTNPNLFPLLESIAQLEEVPEHIENAAINTVIDTVVEASENGSLDDVLDKYDDVANAAADWEDANDFEDPYLDWDFFDDVYFWADDSPSWWGDDYGLY